MLCAQNMYKYAKKRKRNMLYNFHLLYYYLLE